MKQWKEVIQSREEGSQVKPKSIKQIKHNYVDEGEQYRIGIKIETSFHEDSSSSTSLYLSKLWSILENNMGEREGCNLFSRSDSFLMINLKNSDREIERYADANGELNHLFPNFRFLSNTLNLNEKPISKRVGTRLQKTKRSI